MSQRRRHAAKYFHDENDCLRLTLFSIPILPIIVKAPPSLGGSSSKGRGETEEFTSAHESIYLQAHPFELETSRLPGEECYSNGLQSGAQVDTSKLKVRFFRHPRSLSISLQLTVRASPRIVTRERVNFCDDYVVVFVNVTNHASSLPTAFVVCNSTVDLRSEKAQPLRHHNVSRLTSSSRWFLLRDTDRAPPDTRVEWFPRRP